MSANEERSVGQIIQYSRKAQGWTQEQLAQRSGVPYTTLIKVESGAIKSPSLEVISKLARSLSLSLDELVSPTVFRGRDALERLFTDILATLREPGEWMGITGVSEKDYLQHDEKKLKEFISILRERGFKQRLLSSEDETVFLEDDHLEYRAIPKRYFSAVPFYIYGNKVAILIWGEPLQVIIMQNPHMAEAMRRFFLFVWDQAETVKRKPSR